MIDSGRLRAGGRPGRCAFAADVWNGAADNGAYHYAGQRDGSWVVDRDPAVEKSGGDFCDTRACRGRCLGGHRIAEHVAGSRGPGLGRRFAVAPRAADRWFRRVRASVVGSAPVGHSGNRHTAGCAGANPEHALRPARTDPGPTDPRPGRAEGKGRAICLRGEACGRPHRLREAGAPLRAADVLSEPCLSRAVDAGRRPSRGGGLGDGDAPALAGSRCRAALVRTPQRAPDRG